ncbi:MAG TPA: MSMEG_0570 family nitrogen starvation response protein [Candidatus Kapabacteria bacterium]|nr:MSMEG_0570 family nitrogen starvation response protein [Candidatus Kapabacteria bacterium]
MPETYFDVRWPDGHEETCYSPSSVVADFFQPATTYPLADFLARSEDALMLASERVRQKFGYSCSSAADQLQRIRQTAEQFSGQGAVTVLRIHS